MKRVPPIGGLAGAGAIVTVLAMAMLSGCSPGDAANSSAVGARVAADQQGAAGDGDPDHGRQLFMNTCASCHGANGQGLPHQGVNLRASEFVGKQDNEHLLFFLRAGRQPTDPATREGLVMPPRGGDPTLDDDALRDVVAYLRVMRGE